MAIRELEASLAKLCSAHSKLLLPCLSSSGTATKILSSTAKGGLSAASLVLLTAVLKVCWCVLSGVCPLPVPAFSISDFAASAQERMKDCSHAARSMDYNADLQDPELKCERPERYKRRRGCSIIKKTAVGRDRFGIFVNRDRIFMAFVRLFWLRGEITGNLHRRSTICCSLLLCQSSSNTIVSMHRCENAQQTAYSEAAFARCRFLCRNLLTS